MVIDRSSFEELVRAHARIVWAAVYGVVRDPAWTEDLVQEAFLKAWESLGDLKEPEAFRPWILTTARRLAWRRAELLGRPNPAPREEAASDGPMDGEEAREKVRDALGRLPEQYRIPVTMHLLNGMNYVDIGRRLGMKNGSLRGLIARGTKKLRAELAPWWRKSHEGA